MLVRTVGWLSGPHPSANPVPHLEMGMYGELRRTGEQIRGRSDTRAKNNRVAEIDPEAR